MLIIVCDDNEDDRRLAERTLARVRPDVAVEFCNDGEMARVRLAQDPTPDLVLVDYRMPRLHGDEIIRSARPHLPETPIVLFCSDISPNEVEICLSAGADRWQPKPQDFEEYRNVLVRLADEYVA